MNNQSLFGARLDDVHKWLSGPHGNIHLIVCQGFESKDFHLSSPTSPTPDPSNKSNGQTDQPIPTRLVSPTVRRTTEEFNGVRKNSVVLVISTATRSDETEVSSEQWWWADFEECCVSSSSNSTTEWIRSRWSNASLGREWPVNVRLSSRMCPSADLNVRFVTRRNSSKALLKIQDRSPSVCWHQHPRCSSDLFVFS